LLVANGKPQQGAKAIGAQYSDLGTSIELDIRFDPNDPSYINQATGKPQTEKIIRPFNLM
jgi:hypothetical protein